MAAKRKTTRSRHQLSGISQQPTLAAAGGFLLIYALLAALFYPNAVPVDTIQLPNWYTNYAAGYNHRGVMGSLFQLLHGAPSVEKIQSIIPSWDYTLLIILVIFAWALLVPRILLLPLSSAQKGFLLSVAAVLLLAPVWRTNVVNIGFMDKYVLLMVFTALTMLIANKPWWFAVFASLGYLIHPMMIFYLLLFLMLVIHGCIFFPRYGRRYKTWLFCALLPIGLTILLYFLNNPQNTIDQLVQHGYPNEELLGAITKDFLSPEGNATGIKIAWQLFPRNVWLGLLIFAAVPLLFSIITAVYLRHCGADFHLPEAVQKVLPNTRWLAVLARHHLLILLPLASLFSLPIHIVSVDWSRHFYWAWWGIAIAYSYLLWLMPAIQRPPPRHKKNERRHILIPTVLFFIIAYTFSGSALNVSHLNRPYIFRCNQFCIPLLTSNPLGQAYSDAVFSLLTRNLLPIHGNGNQAINYLRLDEPPPLTESTAEISADYSGDILALSFTTIPETIIFTINYEANDIPRLSFRTGDKMIKPFRQTETQTQWAVKFEGIALPFYHVSTQSSAFTFQSFSVEAKK